MLSTGSVAMNTAQKVPTPVGLWSSGNFTRIHKSPSHQVCTCVMMLEHSEDNGMEGVMVGRNIIEPFGDLELSCLLIREVVTLATHVKIQAL